MLHGIFILVVDSIAGVLAGVLLLRFWMQAVRIRPPASVAPFIFQLSDWLVLRLRRIVPGVRGYDWASLAAACLVVLLSKALDFWNFSRLTPEIILLLAVLRFVEWIMYGFMALILIEAVFSWVNPYAPLAPFVRALNEPLLRPLRRIIPLIGNVDLTPLAALLLLQIAQQLMNTLVVSLL
jgi:YggT family protein